MADERDQDEEFRRLVEGLELDTSEIDFSALDERESRVAPEPDRAAAPETDALDDLDDDPWDAAEPQDEPFYRQVTPPPLPEPDRVRTLGWAGTLGAPALLVAATLFGFVLPQLVVLGAVLIFVAGVIALISRLPARGPSHPDFPDDGAVL